MMNGKQQNQRKRHPGQGSQPGQQKSVRSNNEEKLETKISNQIQHKEKKDEEMPEAHSNDKTKGTPSPK
jgi:hypothetical protein